MRPLLLFFVSMIVVAQSPLSSRIAEYVKWRKANPGLRSQEQELKTYKASLSASGVSEQEVEAIMLDLTRNWEKVEAARWDASLNDPNYPMNRNPNRWLVEAVKGRKPGRALDIGMGTGRNSLFLAQQGWTVSGFDYAAQAVSAARKKAEEHGLKIDASVRNLADFNFGREQWDVVVDMYEFQPVRTARRKIYESLKPGGLWIIEGFAAGSPSQQPNPKGEGAYQSGELLELLADDFKIVKYEEVSDTADFGLQVVPLIRVIAQKK
jgi:SAM-dependent methyltransferase